MTTKDLRELAQRLDDEVFWTLDPDVTLGGPRGFVRAAASQLRDYANLRDRRGDERGTMPASAVPSKPAASSSRDHSGAGTEQTAPAPPLIVCGVPTPDRSGRACDKPRGHEGDHWTYGGATLTWEQTAPAEPPANNDEDESFKDWTPKFTVWLVRDGESWPMLIDTVWLNEADAQKRAELRGGKWHAMKYSHLQGPREAADGRSSAPAPQPRSGDTR